MITVLNITIQVFSIKSVQTSVTNGIKWIAKNKEKTTKERIAIIYAWNENGEGSWLTPGSSGFTPLKGVKDALDKN